MIDMGAVLGGRATVGKNCHIGAGTVLAGVVEPASATPVIIEDNVMIGANAYFLRIARAAEALASVHGLHAAGAQLSLCCTHLVKQHRCRAAWRIGLLVVVRLHDLDVETREFARRLGYKVPECRDADGVVARPHDGGDAAQFAQDRELLIRIACGPAYQGGAGPAHVAGDSVECGHVREIDDDLRSRGGLKLFHLKADLRHHLEQRLARAVAHFAGGAVDEGSHATRAADNDAKQEDQPPS